MDQFLINKWNSRACRSGRSTGAVHSSYRHDHVTITERPAHGHRPWSAGIYSPLSQLRSGDCGAAATQTLCFGGVQGCGGREIDPHMAPKGIPN